MRVRLVPRAARGAALAAAVTTAAAGCLAGPAMADTSPASTIAVATGAATPEQAVPGDLSFTGTNALTRAAEAEAVIRPAGGLACQGSYQDDVSAVGFEDTTILAPGMATV